MFERAAAGEEHGHIKGVGEKVVKGLFSSGGPAVVAGRVCRPGTPGTISDAARILCLFDIHAVEEAERRSLLASAAGVVLAPSVISPWLLDLLISERLPYLMIKESFSPELFGKAALLDTRISSVIIDPDIDTLNSYAAENDSSAQNVAELVRSGIDDGRSFRLSSIKELNGGGALIEGLDSLPRCELLDALCEIAEQFCGMPLTIGLPLPYSKSESESFSEMTEAIFRAAVYGNFSVQLEGFRCNTDIALALSLMHRVFCRLEEEGREFNGYLPRGILINSPLWLMRPSPLSKADFVCFDFDALAERLFGIDDISLSDTNVPREPLLELWETYFSHFAPRCRFKARSSRLFSSELFKEWSELAGISEIYVPPAF